MKETAFIRGDWLEFAASLYPEKVLVYSYAVRIPDLLDVNQERFSVPYRQTTPTNSVVRRKSA
jgi:hypothetical protein